MPWGFWATIGLSFLILLVQEVVAGFVFVTVMIRHGAFDVHALTSDGLILVTVVLVSAPLTILVSLLFAKLRKGPTITEYFCLYSPGKRQYLNWSLSVLLFALCSDGLSALLRRPVPEFMVHAYRTVHFTPLLWVAFVAAAPLAEEVVFRGFFFKGIESTKIGGTGAVLLSSFGWAALHIQYDLYNIGTIFVFGLLLGIARLKSRSIYVPTLMHAMWDLMATTETAIYVKMFLT